MGKIKRPSIIRPGRRRCSSNTEDSLDVKEFETFSSIVPISPIREHDFEERPLYNCSGIEVPKTATDLFKSTLANIKLENDSDTKLKINESGSSSSHLTIKENQSGFDFDGKVPTTSLSTLTNIKSEDDYFDTKPQLGSGVDILCNIVPKKEREEPCSGAITTGLGSIDQFVAGLNFNPEMCQVKIKTERESEDNFLMLQSSNCDYTNSQEDVHVDDEDYMNCIHKLRTENLFVSSSYPNFPNSPKICREKTNPRPRVGEGASFRIKTIHDEIKWLGDTIETYHCPKTVNLFLEEFANVQTVGKESVCGLANANIT